MLHNVNVLMPLNHTLKNDKFYVYFTTREKTRNRKSGSHTACTSPWVCPVPPASLWRSHRAKCKLTSAIPSRHALCWRGCGNKVFLFHLESFQAQHELETAALGLGVCSLSRGREARWHQGWASTTPWTLDSTTNTYEHVALNQIPQD